MVIFRKQVETVEEKRIEMEKEIEEIERRIDEQEREIEKKKKHAKMNNFGDDREEEMIKF